MLYDEDFCNEVKKINLAWKKPLVSFVTNGETEQHRNLKILIEKWFSRISEDKKAEYSSRLKSLDDEVFIAQLSEFLVFEYCEQKYPLEIDPKLDSGKTPEMIWNVDDERVILDVVTIFDNKISSQKEKRLEELINYLSDDFSNYSFGIYFEDIDASKLKKKKIKTELKHCVQLEESFVNFDIEEFGFKGRIEIITKEVPGKVNFFVEKTAKEISPLASIEKRIKSKVSKYKWDGALMVAIFKDASFGADVDDVEEVLYGTKSCFYNPEKKAVTEKTNLDGFYTKLVNGKFQNTSLTGVLYCQLVWDEQPRIKVTYFMNPNAKYKLNLSE